jgi:O-antigen ligase
MSLFWSEYQNWSFLLELTFYILFVVFIITFCKLRKPAIVSIGQLLFYVIFFIVAVGFFRLLTGRSPWFEFTNHYETEIGTRNSDIFMVVTALPVALSFVLLMYRKRLKKLIAILITCLYMTALLLSLSRGQIITSILVLAILSFVYSLLTNVNYRLSFSAMVMVFLLIVTCWLLFTHYFSDEYHVFKHRFNTIGQSERIAIASFALEVAKEHPLTGIGLENLKFIMPQRLDAHNAYLNILAELGIVGLTLFCLILFYPVYGYSKIFRDIKFSTDTISKGIYIQGFGFIIALIISSLFDTFYNYIYFWIIYVFSCCDLIYLRSVMNPHFRKEKA